MTSPEIKIAEHKNVAASTQIASDACAGCNASSWLKFASHAETAASTANMIEPTGIMPKAANKPSEFADASWSGSFTMFGTVASLAGPHNSVSTSSENEMTTSPQMLLQKGNATRSAARPMSVVTMTT